MAFYFSCSAGHKCNCWLKIVDHWDRRDNGVISLTKLMVSHDLLRSIVTKQIAFDQGDLHSTPAFECAMDHRCQVLVSRLETLNPSLLPNCYVHRERN